MCKGHRVNPTIYISIKFGIYPYHVLDQVTRHLPGRQVIPRALGRDPDRDRAADLARRALRVRAAGRARLRAIASVLPFENAQGCGARERSSGRALGLLRVES